MINSLAITICTKDREHTLNSAFESAAASVEKAGRQKQCEILVIDDGNLSETYIRQLSDIAVFHGITFKYYKKTGSQQKGLYGSRRLAVELLETSHVLFVDDDCMLHETYIAQAYQRFETNNNLVALSGVDRRNVAKPTAEQRRFWQFFLLCGDEDGKLSPTGFNYGHSFWPEKLEPFECDFVHGCNMLFDLSALRPLPDCQWLEGHSMCEDLVLAHVAGKKGQILIDPHLEFDHLEIPGGRGSQLKRLKRKISCHWHFNRLLHGPGIYDVLFMWSVLGGLAHIAMKMIAKKLGADVHVKA